MAEYVGLRRAFRWLNRGFMVPVLRAGFGPLLVSPFGGYILVLTTLGRKTGRPRHTPVNYALLDGDVYCIAGFGQVADWYRNLAAIPEVAVQLPAGRIWGRGDTVQDPALRLRVARQVLRNAGLAGFFFGFNPFTTSDEALERGIAAAPVVRIRPQHVLPSVHDPGGAGWVLPMLGWAALLGWLIVAIGR